MSTQWSPGPPAMAGGVRSAIVARSDLQHAGRRVSVTALISSLVHQLPPRIARLLDRSPLYVGGPEGIAAIVRAELEPLRIIVVEGALAGAVERAHQHLRQADIDLAVAAGLDDSDRPQVVAVVREADAIASGDPVLGVIGASAQSGPAAGHPSGEVGGGTDVATGTGTDVATGRGTGEPRLILWSGADADDEARVRADVHDLVTRASGQGLDPIPTQVPHGLSAAGVRAAAVGTHRDLLAAVDAAASRSVASTRPIALMLPGQGSQYPAMASGLYGREPTFSAGVDAVLQALGDEGERIRDDWLAGTAAAVSIDETRRSQPLIFAVDYALARMLTSWGVGPAALIGHSAGELVAGALAEVFTVPDAVRVMMGRVAGALTATRGGMLAVAAAADELDDFLEDGVTVAAINAARQTMIAGPTEPLARVEAAMLAADLTVRTVPATHPFHSPAMAEAAALAETDIAALDLQPPRMTVYSGYTAARMTAADATSPGFWANQVVLPVRFAGALDALLQTGDYLLVECGAGQTLTSFARRHRAVRTARSEVVPLLPPVPGPPNADRRNVMEATGRIWVEGHDLHIDSIARL